MSRVSSVVVIKKYYFADVNIHNLRKLEIREFIELSCADIHTFLWEDSFVITNWHGKRRWIEYSKGLEYIKNIVTTVRDENKQRIKD